MIVTLPLPDRGLSPNERTHWGRLSKLKKSHRRAAYYAARHAMNEQGISGIPWVRCSVQVYWFAKRKPFPDGDNATAILKSVFDGIADSGIVKNDKRFIHQPVLFRWDKLDPRVEIRLRKL